jgi:hypothetical protein
MSDHEENSNSDISSVSSTEELQSSPKRTTKKKKTSENVRVICRFRPSNDLELANDGEECVEFDPEGTSLKFKVYFYNSSYNS